MHNYSTQEDEERSSQLDSSLHLTHSQSYITDKHDSTYGMLSLNRYSLAQNEGELEYHPGSQIYQNEVLNQLSSSRLQIQQGRHYERSYSSSSDDHKDVLVDDSNDINYFSSPKNFPGQQDDQEYDQNDEDYYQQPQEYPNNILQPLILRQFSDNPFSGSAQKGSFQENLGQCDNNIQLFQQSEIIPELFRCYSNEISSCYISQCLDSGKNQVSFKSSLDQCEKNQTEINLQNNKEQSMNNNQLFQKYSQNHAMPSDIQCNFQQNQQQYLINNQNRKQDQITQGESAETHFYGASQFQVDLQKQNTDFKQSLIEEDKNQLFGVIIQRNPKEQLTCNKLSQSTLNALAIQQQAKQTISQIQIEECEPRSVSASTSSTTVNSTNEPLSLPQDTCSQSENQEMPNKLAQKVGEINKKNIVRNIIRAFKRYFLNKRAKPLTPLVFFPQENIDECRSKFKSFFKDKKFNNSILKRLVTDKLYGGIFEYFLQNQSDNYIAVSNVKAKDSHRIFVEYLLICFKDTVLLDNIETYTKNF